MKLSLKRIQRGAIVLGLVFLAGVIGFRCYGRSWVESFYMTVITISTVGFGEHTDLPDSEQLFISFLLIFGISAAVYTLGGFINMMAEGEVDRALGVYRLTRGIERLHDHIIICGYGRIGHVLAAELEEQGCPLVIIDSDNEQIALVGSRHLAYSGDATEEDVLKACGVERARTLVTALPNDAANVFITLTARNLNPKLQIIARGESASTQKKLLQAGATRVVQPALIGAQRIAAMITKPSTIEFLELVAGRSVLDVEIDEVVVPPTSAIIGKTVVETETKRRHGLLIVAVKQQQGAMIFNPDSNFRISAGDTVIVMGKPPSIARFCEEYGLS